MNLPCGPTLRITIMCGPGPSLSKTARDCHCGSMQEQLLAAEQKKYELGASIPSNVIMNERDLATAQSTELTALTTHIRARVALDRTLGWTLAANHVTVEEAMAGVVTLGSK